MLGTLLGYAASTSLGQSVVKSYIKDEMEKNFKEGKQDFEKLKKFIERDEELSDQLSDTLKKIEAKTTEFLDFATRDEQLDVFAKIIADKIPKFNGSLEQFKKFCMESPAFKKMQQYSEQLLSPKIFQGILSVAEKSGHIEKLSNEEQLKLITILKSAETAENLQKIDLKKAVGYFEVNARAFCKELEINEDDMQDLETIFEELKRDHFASAQKIKKELEASVPTILQKLLAYVYEKCPELAIDKAPSKAITHAKNTAKTSTAPKSAPKVAPKKKSAPQKPEKEEVVELSDSEEPEVKQSVKKPAPKRKKEGEVVISDTQEQTQTVKKKKGPGKK